MRPLIVLGIAAGIAAFKWLMRREINLPDAEPWAGRSPADDDWVELCNVDDVSVLFKSRLNPGGAPRLRVCQTRRHSDSNLFEAVTHGGLVLKPAESGDPSFDSLVAVGGNPLLLAAALDQATRKCLIKLFHESRVVHAGCAATPVADLPAREIMKECPELLKVAKNMSPRRLIGEHLNAVLRHLHTDPVPEVRKRNLKVLLHEFSGDAVSVSVAREALQNSDPDVRVMAAEFLSARGWLPEDGALALAPSEGGEISLPSSPAPSTNPAPKE
jgi:hypothetical protein